MVRAATLVLVTLAAVTGPARTCPAQWPEKQFATPGHKRPDGLFAPGVAVGKTLYVAGKGDYKPDLDTDGKVKNCLAEVRKTLALGGMDFSNVVKHVRLPGRPRPVRGDEQGLRRVLPRQPPGADDPGGLAGPRRLPARDHLRRLRRPSPSQARSAPPGGLPVQPRVSSPGGTLYVSGKGDQLPGGGHPEGFEAQARQAMKNVEATLKAAGLGFGARRHDQRLPGPDGRRRRPSTGSTGEFVRPGDEPAVAWRASTGSPAVRTSRSPASPRPTWPAARRWSGRAASRSARPTAR